MRTYLKKTNDEVRNIGKFNSNFNVGLFLDGKVVGYEILDEYELSDIHEIKVSFDPRNKILYSHYVEYGMICILTKNGDHSQVVDWDAIYKKMDEIDEKENKKEN